MKKTMKMMVALGLSGAMIMGGSMAVSAEEEVHLTLLHHLNEQGKKDGLVALSEAFTEQNPNIIVDVEFLSQEDYINTIKQRAAADNMPDFINYRPAAEPTLIEAGLIEPLDESVYPDEIDSSLIESVSIDGIHYGIPLDRGGYGLYYNETLLEQVGASVEDLSTISGLLDTCKKLKDAGITPLSSGYAESWTESLIFDPCITSGLQVIYPDACDQLMAGTKKFADYPEILDIVDHALTLSRDYTIVDAKAASQTASDQYAQFGRGDSAMMIQGSWAISDIMLAKEAAGNNDKFGFTVFPWCDDVENNKMGANADDTFMIASGSKHKEEALQFAQFCMTAEAAQIWMENSNTITSRSDVDPVVDNDLTKQVKDSLDNKAFFYETYGLFSGQQYNDYVRLFVEKRASGATAEDIIESWDETFANILSAN